eukprot:TRINITY_DN745_c0_g1_i2.p1 TRINITY_DN745_c0_g1~~TRINITY_DN745_c0_g1_i2.p1  ORF type:complete len:155 (+),score=15.83 TRINITY_DN745_c0_g1_i2:64-465(+)
MAVNMRYVFAVVMLFCACSFSGVSADSSAPAPSPEDTPCSGYWPGFCPAGEFCSFSMSLFGFDCFGCPVNTFEAKKGYRFTCHACPPGTSTHGRVASTECTPVPSLFTAAALDDVATTEGRKELRMTTAVQGS